MLPHLTSLAPPFSNFISVITCGYKNATPNCTQRPWENIFVAKETKLNCEVDVKFTLNDEILDFKGTPFLQRRGPPCFRFLYESPLEFFREGNLHGKI